MINSKADVVGSLLRPPELLAAQKQFAAGALTSAEFKRVEDRAVDDAVALQEEAGLEIVTDGEMRRQSFQSQMTAAVEGFGEHTLDAFLWGEWHGGASRRGARRSTARDPVPSALGSADVGDWSLSRPPGLGVVGKLRRRRHLCAAAFT